MSKRPKVEKTDQEWSDQLTPQQYMVTRQHGTEPAFSHPYHNDKREGVYRCICCGEPLFSSDSKFDSGTGWPSFFVPAAENAVAEHEDNSLFMRRTEVRCASCDAHLGHVFPDGPEPTGQRYCINGLSLSLENTAAEKDEE
ncbi:MAG: peptide-methionine (R)-S-oxide reductase MsrB [Hyphomicrobiales bacterium]|nr:peptide-methionine (R)-S-oxide reductase MsrB [Hyphomicrobiales bacterium]